MTKENCQFFSYLTAHHEFHDEEPVLLIFVDVVELDDIGVVYLLEDHDLVLKTHFVLFGQLASREKEGD